jgi:hypothetical protein
MHPRERPLRLGDGVLFPGAGDAGVATLRRSAPGDDGNNDMKTWPANGYDDGWDDVSRKSLTTHHAVSLQYFEIWYT